jgi:hypothetical protein
MFHAQQRVRLWLHQSEYDGPLTGLQAGKLSNLTNGGTRLQNSAFQIMLEICQFLSLSFCEITTASACHLRGLLSGPS